jgi:hypothetical protein
MSPTLFDFLDKAHGAPYAFPHAIHDAYVAGGSQYSSAPQLNSVWEMSGKR